MQNCLIHTLFNFASLFHSKVIRHCLICNYPTYDVTSYNELMKNLIKFQVHFIQIVAHYIRNGTNVRKISWVFKVLFPKYENFYCKLFLQCDVKSGIFTY